MKIFQILIFILLILGFNSFVKAQACGYVYITVYLTDQMGNQIKNVDFKFYDRKYESAGLHRDDLMKWNSEKSGYFGSEGMCGGHYNVKMEISAEGFDKFVRDVDLPLGRKSFSVKLKRNGINEEPYFESLANFRGKVSTKNGYLLSKTQIVLTDNNKRQFKTFTKDGRFEIDVPKGQYRIEFIQSEDFLPTVFENKNLDTGSNFVEVLIKRKNNK